MKAMRIIWKNGVEAVWASSVCRFFFFFLVRKETGGEINGVLLQHHQNSLLSSFGKANTKLIPDSNLSTKPTA